MVRLETHLASQHRPSMRILSIVGDMLHAAGSLKLMTAPSVSGKGASADEITRVLYLCTRLRPVREIASVECYHVGDELIVEVDIILPVTSSLHYAHDVAETAQCLIEVSRSGIVSGHP